MALDRKGMRLGDIFLEGWRPYAWIFILAFALYLKTLSFGFCNFDDQELIVQNRDFLCRSSNIFHAFTQKVYPNNTVTPYYRPLLIVSFMLNCLMGGLDPLVYHLTNVFIHIAVSSLVFLFFMKVGIRRGPSLFFALIFAVHPALSQAVAWVPGRNDSLLALSVLASFISLVDYLETGKAARFALHLGSLAAALFTKESAVIVVPLSYLYIAVAHGPAEMKKRWKGLLAGQLAVLAAWAVPRHLATTASEQISTYDLYNLILPQVPALLQLAGKALIPIRQSVFPVMRGEPVAYGVAVAALLAVSFAMSPRKDRGLIFFGLSWFAIFLIPPLLRPHAPAINDVLEHRLYLPVIGLGIALAGSWPVKKYSGSRVLRAVGVAIIAAAFAKTFFYIDNFRDDTAFWENAVKHSPRSAFCRFKLGETYYRLERFDDAIEKFNQAVRLDQFTSMSGHYYLGHIWLKKGDLGRAGNEFRKAVALMPDNEWAYMSLGVVCYRDGKAEEARRCWERSLEIRPDNVDSLRNLAIYHADRGELDAARAYAARLKALGVRAPEDFLKKVGAR